LSAARRFAELPRRDLVCLFFGLLAATLTSCFVKKLVDDPADSITLPPAGAEANLKG